MIYQIVWVRLFALSVGSNSLALSMIIGSFFFGLGVGSLLARYINYQNIDPLRVYALLEIVIAISGILLLPILLNLDYIIANFSLFLDIALFKFLLVFILLLIPTASMGATLPVVSTLVINEKKTMGKRYAQIYSINTFGAVVGALLGGFLLIPLIGLDGAIYIAFLINFSISIIAFYLFKKSLFTSKVKSIKKQVVSSLNSTQVKVLFILFVTGFASIATEIGWTKFLIIFTGSTIYGFSIILAILLSGIAIGSWVVRKYIDSIKDDTIWLSYSLVLLSILLIVTYSGLSYIPPLYEYLNQSNINQTLQNLIKYSAIFLLVFPSSFMFGTIFPLSLSLYTKIPSSVQKSSSDAFGINTIAGILGSIIAGFWIIPYFGTGALLLSMAAVIVIVSGIFLFDKQMQKHKFILGGIIGITFLMLIYLPSLNYKPLIVASYNHTQQGKLKDLEFTFLQEGKSGVIALFLEDSRYARLLNNGLSEASLDISNDDNVNLGEALLGFIPYFLHKDPKNSFVVGFGGGTTVYALTRTKIDSIKVVELEPLVIQAIKSIYPNGIPPLKDKRVIVEFNDARHLLLSEKQKYDIIISQPSHPWLSGASSLFTKEFFTITNKKLKDDGIYGQWINLFNMDATTLKSIIKSFNEVYPYSLSFMILKSEDFLIFGSQKPLEFHQVQEKINEPKIANILRPYMIKTPKELYSYIALKRVEMDKMTENAINSTDTNIICETRLSTLGWRRPLKSEDPYDLINKNRQ